MAAKCVACLIAVFLMSLPAAAADFDKGLAAKKRGDFGAALREWRPLAARGNAAAQNAIGVLYDNGQGVPQDHATALNWYRKAAKKGNADAQNNLGMMYANGLGVPQDYAKAAAWYRKAADQGHKEARTNLGVLRLMGRIPRDAAPSATVSISKSTVKETRVSKRKVAPEAGLDTVREEAKTEVQPSSVAPTKDEHRIETEMAQQGAPTSGAVGSPEAQALQASLRDDAGSSDKKDKIERITELAKAAEGTSRETAVAPDSGDATDTPPDAEEAAVGKPKMPTPEGRFHVQLSSVKTELRAKKEAARLKQAYDSILGPLQVEPVRANLGERGVFYRLYAGPLPTYAAARSLCRELSARNQGCIVKTR